MDRKSNLKPSQASHGHIINDTEVQEYLKNCAIPVEGKEISLDVSLVYDLSYPSENAIQYIIAIDGARTTIPVKKTFPSSLITFFQFGSLLLKSSDLETLEQQPFISPSDIKALKNIGREKFVLPTKNVALVKEDDLKTSVRKAIQDFFRKKDPGNTSMLNTLYWFLFELYNHNIDKPVYKLSQCPTCHTTGIELKKDTINLNNYSWECINEKCKSAIYLTDVFRLFEKADNDSGAEGILSYTSNLVESFLIIHTIKNILEIEDGFINSFLFIKDGPLSFGGETANMHKPMQAFLNFFQEKYNVNLIGVETSGAFVDHAKEIKDKLKPGQVLLLSNHHIFSYIQPGKAESNEYASTSYYGGKFIYKSLDERIYVLTLPVKDHKLFYKRPQITDLKNIGEILLNIDKLKCDIYQNALIPVALANKLISLSNSPSSNILEKFAKNSIVR